METLRLTALLLLHILSSTRVLPTELPMPADVRLQGVIDEILSGGAWETPAVVLAANAAMSERTLSRHFMDDLGMSLRSWRHRARILISMDLLVTGVPVKTVSHTMGFASPAAYVAAFRKVLGVTPASYASLASSEALPMGGRSN